MPFTLMSVNCAAGQNGKDTNWDVLSRIQVSYSSVTDTGNHWSEEERSVYVCIYTVNMHVYVYNTTDCSVFICLVFQIPNKLMQSVQF